MSENYDTNFGYCFVFFFVWIIALVWFDFSYAKLNGVKFIELFFLYKIYCEIDSLLKFNFWNLFTYKSMDCVINFHYYNNVIPYANTEKTL